MGWTMSTTTTHLMMRVKTLNALRLERKHVVVNCTVSPTYLDRVAAHLLRDCVETTLSYNPEFIAQGDVVRGLRNPDMVLIGEQTPDAGALLEAMWLSVVENQPTISRMSRASAEICKLAVNCFVTTKISYANMVGEICQKTPGADVDAVLAAVGADARVGSMCLRYGAGFGGPCFPRDNRALGHHARAVGVQPLMSDATDAMNKAHLDFCVRKVLEMEQTVFVMSDVAYKRGCPVDIIEESQRLAVAVHVARAGKRVRIKDREGIVELVRRQYGSLFEYEVTAPGVANTDSGNALSSHRQ